MDFKDLLLNFEGRISRRSYWIGLATLIVLSLLATMALMPLFHVAYEDMRAIPRPPGAEKISLLVNLLMLWPSLAITIKRLHDHNKPALVAIILYILFALFTLMQYLGMAGTPQQPDNIFLGVVLLMVLLGIWMLVNLGFIRGTTGDNDYGPDPLAAPDLQTDPSANDQQEK